jgi:hypothetical protein
MKKKGGIKINIQLSNRWLYTFIVLGILAIVTVGVYAVQQSSSGGGTHNYAEIGFPSCSNGKILKWSSGAWNCGDDIDTDTNTDYCFGGSCAGAISASYIQIGGDYVTAESSCSSSQYGQIKKCRKSWGGWLL